ncbi:putative RNA methyltransferase [Philodulcilactobacillus myokoensis]|uniref:RNA methyltransferase n=1 Tax=Philodulcilactobacillus myokoensis TaxID=2929573 RepID=A0A9W6B271_9LACO|nr:23S rRNA (uracil(1939)-C(5))-methyltransferase RlmD [Philodulcilactobacillus myokoensis]GLB47298.1 putative RNA methyltransferase [Philodulcilactobacillus myokoensis]
MQKSKIKVGQKIQVATQAGVNHMGINGEAIAFYQKKLVFVKGALPQERIIATITDVYNHYLRADVNKVIRKNPERVKPIDSYANHVGGFELENMAYPMQLKFKRAMFKQALSKYRPLGYKEYEVRKTIGMDHPYGYRNKAQFQIRADHGKVMAGLYQVRSHKLIDLKTCSVQYPKTIEVMRKIVAIVQDLKLPVYDEKHNSGILKTVVVRAALNTDDVQVVFITNTDKMVKKHQLLDAIKQQMPEVTSVMQNVNPGRTSLIWGETTTKLSGQSSINEKIGDTTFKLSARAFLQLNSYMMPKLYELADRALDLDHNRHLVDAYSGVGTIGLPLAKRVDEVRGMDTISDAVNDANENASINKIKNAHYEVGKAETLLPQWVNEGWQPDALIVDPPRTGLANSLIETIMKVQPTNFVYVSCNPATLARDLVALVQKYRIHYIQPIDMMPQTARCEAVVKFSLRKSNNRK